MGTWWPSYLRSKPLLSSSSTFDKMIQVFLILIGCIGASYPQNTTDNEEWNGIVNAPATFNKGRPGQGGHGGHGGGHGGGRPHGGGWNCCLFAKAYCKLPCKGKLCTQTCTVKCFPFGWVTCDPIPCQEANPWGCIGTTTTTTTTVTTTTTTSTRCGADWTEVGNKCYYLASGPANYLIALTSCIGLGGTLATIENQAEQDALATLTDPDGAYIGLTDFLNEGTFAWVDGAATGFTNWYFNAPNNGNDNQHCVWIRPDDEWDDVRCETERAFVCQKLI